jgi:hypothetical protein
MKYVIIESLSAYNYGKKNFNKDKIIWVTTSPEVCEFFFKNNIKFINIENLVNKKDLNTVTELSVKISELCVKKFDELFLKKKYYISAFLVGTDFLRNVHTLIYKNYLLNKLLSFTKSTKVICIGDPDEKKMNDNFSLEYNSYENLFSIIINNCDSKIKLIKFKNKEVFFNKSNFFFIKKIISFVNINFAQFLFKLYSKGLLINFNNNKKKNLLILNETDHITKSLIKLKKNFNIKFFKEKFTILKQEISSDYNLRKKLELEYKNKLNEAIEKSMFFFKSSAIEKEKIIDYKYSISLVLHKFLKFKNSINANLDKIESQFNQLIINLDKKTFILSNYSLNFMNCLFVLYCKYKNMKIILCEHGLLGISNSDRYLQKFDKMSIADYGVYYWKKSIIVRKNLLKIAQKQKKIISGFPNFYKQHKFIIIIKKILLKLILRLSIKKKVIIVLSDLEKNNSTYPGGTHDYEITNNNKKIIKYLAQSNPDKIVILKLYPVQKYINLYNYDDLLSKFNNVKVVRSISFYYLRDLADEIYLWHASATLLDCVLSESKKVYFIKLPEIKCFINDFIDRKIYHKTNFKSQWFLLKKKYIKISFNWINVIN